MREKRIKRVPILENSGLVASCVSRFQPGLWPGLKARAEGGWLREEKIPDVSRRDWTRPV
jgi:hypothetical protein